MRVLYADEWSEVSNVVQSALNNSPSNRLNKWAPMRAFSGHPETTPSAAMLKDNVPVNAPLDVITTQKLMKVEKLSKAMAGLQAHVAETATRDRKTTI
jgi:hypothetical protein